MLCFVDVWVELRIRTDYSWIHYSSCDVFNRCCFIVTTLIPLFVLCFVVTCHFPFLFMGREFNECMEGAHGMWCATTYNYDEHIEQWMLCPYVRIIKRTVCVVLSKLYLPTCHYDGFLASYIFQYWPSSICFLFIQDNTNASFLLWQEHCGHLGASIVNAYYKGVCVYEYVFVCVCVYVCVCVCVWVWVWVSVCVFVCVCVCMCVCVCKCVFVCVWVCVCVCVNVSESVSVCVCVCIISSKQPKLGPTQDFIALLVRMHWVVCLFVCTYVLVFVCLLVCCCNLDYTVSWNGGSC